VAVGVAAPATTSSAGRPPRTMDFVRLKLRLMRNGFRGQAWRVAAFVVGVLFGAFMAGLAALGLAATGMASDPQVAYVVAVLAGSLTAFGWALVPLLFFGVDETLDPARFALLPVSRGLLARGMLAAAFAGIPAIATAVALGGLVVAALLRFGLVSAAGAAVGVAVALVLCIIMSRALTSAFANLLRSRRIRDLAAVLIAVLASSIAPLQWLVIAAVEQGSIGQAERVADVLAWTPFGAPFAVPFDVGDGRWAAAALRLAIPVAAIVALVWWWSRTIESAMLGASSGGQVKTRQRRPGGATSGLFPGALRVLPAGPFGAIVAREWRSWWRDPRRRASMISVLMASAVVPVALSVGGTVEGGRGLGTGGLSFAVTMAGTMGGMLLANQFAFDSSAYAAHLLAAVPGRTELRARAAAIGLFAVPVQIFVVLAVTGLFGDLRQAPAGLGILAASFGAAVAAAGALSVLVPYALPENTNPFAMSSGGGSAKGLLAAAAMIVTLVVSLPVVLAAYLLRTFMVGPMLAGPWLVLALGIAYGVVLAVVGTQLAGTVLDRRGPEVLSAITPRR
jgi:ABC-2 type transport system permease protein